MASPVFMGLNNGLIDIDLGIAKHPSYKSWVREGRTLKLMEGEDELTSYQSEDQMLSLVFDC